MNDTEKGLVALWSKMINKSTCLDFKTNVFSDNYIAEGCYISVQLPSLDKFFLCIEDVFIPITDEVFTECGRIYYKEKDVRSEHLRLTELTKGCNR